MYSSWGNTNNGRAPADPLWFLHDTPAPSAPDQNTPATGPREQESKPLPSGPNQDVPTPLPKPVDPTPSEPNQDHVPTPPGAPVDDTKNRPPPQEPPNQEQVPTSPGAPVDDTKNRPPPQEPSTEPPETNTPTKPTPTEDSGWSTGMFAVIIGINLYADPHMDNLKGAVPDADDVNDFLVSTLHVPKEHITNLRNETATRTNIESAIKALGEDKRIKKHDPILIFYAGHGGFTAAPEGWPAGGNIQMLCPYHFVKDGTSDPEGQGVLDIQLSRLLDGVAKKKSNNITVILDCCYSGSGTRTSDYVTFRGVELPPTYTIAPELLNEVNPGTRASDTAKGYEKKGLSSHVLLAACKETQKSQEEFGRGIFSMALMKLFREQGVGKLTYADVITALPPLRNPDQVQQNPQCEGENQHRVLFDARVPGLRREIFELGSTTKAGRYKLYAGEAQGVMPEAEFEVYVDRAMTGAPIGKVKVITTQPFTANCSITPVGQPPFSFVEKFAYAVQTKAGRASDVKFFLDLADEHKALFNHVREEILIMDAGKRGVVFVNSRDEDPDIVVIASGTCLKFEIMDPICRRYGYKYMPFDRVPIERDSIFRILRSASDFYFHLRRASKAPASAQIPQGITLKCYKLKPSGRFDPVTFGAILMPEPNGSNLNEGGFIEVPSSRKTKYGYEIVSNFGELYAALFYFDMSDLSIKSHYLPNTAQRGGNVCSIPTKGSLVVGYGSSGTKPRNFYVRKNQEVDIGFLRLFLSTEYVDLSHIEQSSPFIEDRASNDNEPNRMAIWSAISVPVVVSKSANEEEDSGSDEEQDSDNESV